LSTLRQDVLPLKFNAAKIVKEPKYEFVNGNEFIRNTNQFVTFYHLSNSDFLILKNTILGYVKNGQLDIYLFAKTAYVLFYLAKRNFISETIEEVEEFLLLHIDKTKNNAPYDYRFDDVNFEIVESHENIYDEHIFRSYKLEDYPTNYKNKLEEVYEELKTNFIKTKHEIGYTKWEFSGFEDTFEDIFASLDVNEVVSFIERKLPYRDTMNSFLSKLGTVLLPKLEVGNIKILIEKIEKLKKESIHPVDKYWLSRYS
jgi:hypothetical protein